MKRFILPAILFFVLRSSAQVSIDFDTPVVITFGSTLTGVGNSAFTGTGFQAFPGTGRLNSNAWSVTGISTGDLNFGSTLLTGHVAMGTNSMINPMIEAGVTVGGIYAYTGTPFSIADPAMLIQPTDADCTPGNIILRLKDTHATNSIYLLDISYDLWMRNNKSSSNKLSFSWSEDNITYTTVPALDYTTPTTATALGIESTGTHAYTIVGCDVNPGEYMYLKWTFADVIGTGERDEFYLNSITLSATNLLPLTLISFTGMLAEEAVKLQWTTATETNTSAFIVQRKCAGQNTFTDIGNTEAAGDSYTTLQYAFTDDAPAQGINYYRLKQLDADGSFTFSKTIAVQTGDAGNDLALYPNPAASYITFHTALLQNTNALIKIFDNTGREISLPLLQTAELAHVYSTRQLAEGIYSVIVSAGNTTVTGRFVKVAE